MKSPLNLTLTGLSVLLSTFAIASADVAVDRSKETTVAPGATTTEEKTTVAVVPDASMNKREGKIDRMDPETRQLMLRTKLAKEPIGFTFNAATKVIDLDGKPVEPNLLKPEVPVELSYVEDGNNLIATTVVVQRIQVPLPGGGTTLTNQETRKPGGKVIEQGVKTTTTVTSGAMQTLDGKFLTVKVEGAERPARYLVTDSTRWVDATGAPLQISTVKPGYGVRVSYSKQRDALLADEVTVIVPGADPAPAGGAPVPAPGAPVTPR